MQKFLAFMLVATVLAGCSTDDASEAPEEIIVDDAPVGNVTVNTPPVVNFTANLLNGSAPLLVNFTVNATDVDGDNLTWVAWMNDDNSTELANGTVVPAVFNHTFMEGLWNVTLEVSDANETVSVLWSLNVTSGAPDVRVPVLLEEVVNSGTIGGVYALRNDPNMAAQCVGFVTGQDGVGCVFLDFDNSLAGMPAIVETDAANTRLAIWDECSPTGTGVGFTGDASTHQFVLPAGSGCLVAWSSSTGDVGADRTFTLRIYDWLPEA